MSTNPYINRANTNMSPKPEEEKVNPYINKANNIDTLKQTHWRVETDTWLDFDLTWVLEANKQNKPQTPHPTLNVSNVQQKAIEKNSTTPTKVETKSTTSGQDYLNLLWKYSKQNEPWTNFWWPVSQFLWTAKTILTTAENSQFTRLDAKMAKWELSANETQAYLKLKDKIKNNLQKEIKSQFEQIVKKESDLAALINNPNISESQKNNFRKQIKELQKEKELVWKDLHNIWVPTDTTKWTNSSTNTSTSTTDTKKDWTTSDTTTPTGTSTTSTTDTKTWATTDTSKYWSGIVGQMIAKGLTPTETTRDQRKKMAEFFDISNYEWTKEQNQQLEKLMKEKTADEIRAILKWEASKEEAQDILDATWEEIKNLPKEKDLVWQEDKPLIPWITESIDTSSEDKALEEFEAEIKEEWVLERNLQESIWKYADAINLNAQEKEEILQRAWEKEKELLENQNLDSRERSKAEEEFLTWILNEFKWNVSSRRDQIDASTQRTKDAAWRRSRIAWAVAGQSWRWLSASAVWSIQDSILWLYDEQISDAEFKAIAANTELDQALRDTWLSVFDKQSWINSFLNWLDKEENAPLITALNEITKWNIQAKNDVKDFLTELYAKQTEEDQTRVLQDRRIEAQAEAYAAKSPDQKLEYLYDINKNVDWFDFIADELMTLIADYKDRPYSQLQTKIRKKASRANQSNILSNSLIQKPYSELSDSEKKFMNYLLNRWMDTYIRWDNSVEVTNEVRERFNALQAEWEESNKPEPKSSDVIVETKEDKQKASQEAITNEWSFKWFKSKKLSDRYESQRKALTEAIRKLTPEQKEDEEVIKRVTEANEKLNKFKEQNSI